MLEIYLEDQIFINQNSLLISETGVLLYGIDAFDYSCKQRTLLILKTLEEVKSTKNKCLQYVNSASLIDGLDKLKNTKGYDFIWLDELYYLDFYVIERFGKTQLCTLLHYAK